MSTPEPGQPAQPGPAPSRPGPPVATPVASRPPYGAAPPPEWLPRPTDGLAIAAFVAACVGVAAPVTGPVALGLGIGAQRRVRRTGAPGRGLAIAATWIGGALTALAVIALAVAVAIARAPTGTAT